MEEKEIKKHFPCCVCLCFGNKQWITDQVFLLLYPLIVQKMITTQIKCGKQHIKSARRAGVISFTSCFPFSHDHSCGPTAQFCLIYFLLFWWTCFLYNFWHFSCIECTKKKKTIQLKKTFSRVFLIIFRKTNGLHWSNSNENWNTEFF